MKELHFPKPQPDTAQYEDVIHRGFRRFPSRQRNYEQFKKTNNVPAVDYLPVKMDFENVSRCNLRCEMCQMTEFNQGKRADDMTYDEFRKVLDSLEGIFEIKIQGVGEPFLGRDFTKMVAYAGDKDIWVRSTTNATILDKQDNYKRIIDAGIGEMQISVDGTSKTTYEKIRKNADFEKMAKNCELINAYCDASGTDRTRMWVLLQSDNFCELETFPRFARNLGFKRLTISMDVNGWGSEHKTEKNMKKNVSAKITQEIIDRMLHESNQLGIDLSFWDITSKYTRDNPCPWPFERAFISSDKKVVPCCMIGNPDTYCFGTLGDFSTIWNSDQYREFRQAHLSGPVPDVCRYCYEGEDQ